MPSTRCGVTVAWITWKSRSTSPALPRQWQNLAWSTRQRRIHAVSLSLTRREREVYELLVLGHSNKEIAERLAISARTVEDHRAAIVAKTRTNGLAQLVALSRGEA